MTLRTGFLRFLGPFADVNPKALSMLINEDRELFLVFQKCWISRQLKQKSKNGGDTIAKSLNPPLITFPRNELVKAVTAVVEFATDDGDKQAPILIDDLIDSYEVEVQSFLDKEEKNIAALVAKLRAAVDAKQPDSTLAPMVTKLIQVVKNWDTSAQPIQVSTKSRGLDHEASHRIAFKIRDLAIDMFNKHDKLDFARKLTNMLQEVFAEVVEVAERTAKDADALDEIAEQRTNESDNANSNESEEGSSAGEKWGLGFSIVFIISIIFLLILGW